MDALMTSVDVAKQLNCTVRTVQNLRDRGEIEFVRIGRLIRYTEQQLGNYLDKQTVKPFR
jgi:excisionase family DNA binding protein